MSLGFNVGCGFVSSVGSLIGLRVLGIPFTNSILQAYMSQLTRRSHSWFRWQRTHRYWRWYYQRPLLRP